ncbi:unnamed protein product [Brassica napus]|uniref:(rape) hypothetical protein n=1 Tax=Brassica napus TaxID=3708 RepID=A0A817AVM1_BRANA|nr:unnamed protein product [Brassica napus]
MIKEKDNMRLLIELRDQNLPNDSLALTNNDSTQWSVGTTTSVRAKFFVLNEKRTIREIIDSTLLPAHVVVGLLPQSSSSLLAKPYVPFGAATKLYSNGQVKPAGCYPNRPAGGTRRGSGGMDRLNIPFPNLYI